MENDTQPKSNIGRSILWLVALALVIVGGFALSRQKTGSDTIKIGIILPLSGEVASLGEGSRNGALLMLAGLPQKVQSKIALVFEDDKFDAKNTVSAFNKLTGIDKVSAIVCFASTPCGAVAPLADAQQIPLVAVASAPVQKGRTYVVRLEISTTQEGIALAKYLVSKSYQHIGSIVAIQDGIQSAYNSLSTDAYFASHQVISESVNPGLKDFRTSIAKVLVAKPDVIVVGLLPGGAGIFARQARELGYKGDFVGFNFIEGDETLQTAAGAINGIVYTQAADPTQDFIQKYQQSYGKSFGPGSAHLYDTVKMFSDMVTKGIETPVEIIEQLKSIKDFSGALGIYSSIEDGEFSIPVVLKTVKDNKFQKI